ncbi:MAG: hypothetical protein GY771_15885 [bacterium]|nr:hypothetical protein [bacterium]
MGIYSFKHSVIITFLMLVMLTSVIPASAFPWGVSGGLFRFPATDYYYPNFYDDAGYRGDLYMHLRADKPIYIPLKGRVYGYPGDDNVFEYCLESGPGFRFGEGSNLTVRAEPLLGMGRMKLQYPAPYYPVVTHTYINFVRAGYDANVMRHFGRFALGGNLRYRYLYNIEKNFFDRHTHVVELNGEIDYRWSEALRFSFVGGVEVGGWYPKIFFDRGNVRPYFEVGAHFN